MIVLDTDVLSEVLPPKPESRVLAWLDQRSDHSLFTTAISHGEILGGIPFLADGHRRRALWHTAAAMFEDDLDGRVLNFDDDAAGHYAQIAASRLAAGSRMSQLDATSAAIARSHGGALAACNVQDFEGSGLDIVNPWD